MIHVIILSQKHRERLIQPIIYELNNQSVMPDLITVVFQGYKTSVKSDIPTRLIFLDSNTGSSIRFKYAKSDCINITLDDDFIPKRDYIECLSEFNSRYPNGIGSLWAYRILGNKGYNESVSSLPCWDNLSEDTRVLMVGCGLMVWDERLLRLRSVNFENKKFADIQLAIHCAKEHIQMYAIAHTGKEVEHIGDDDIQSNAVWKDARANIEYLDIQTEKLINIITQ